MGLHAHHIGELVGEIEPLVAGARVRDVAPRPPRDLLLVLERDGGVRRLLVSADPEAGRVHLQSGRLRPHRGSVGPFFRLVADLLVGGTVRTLAQVDGDRIARLTVEGEDGAVHLVAELTGRHANLVLLDRRERVLGMLVPPPPRPTRPPRLVVGEPWRPPPGRAGGGAPPPLATHLPTPEGPRGDPEAPLSWRVEAGLGRAAEERLEAAERRDLLARLNRRRKGLLRRLAGLAERRRACAGAERLREDGELLKSSRGRLRRGLAEIELPDFFADGAPPRTIALDPRLGPENVERAFARYRKLVRQGAGLDAEEGSLRATLEALDAALARAGDPCVAPRGVEEEAVAQGILPPRQEPGGPRRSAAPTPRRPYRRFHGSAGSEIRVGRSAADNDRLTLRESRGNDLWLHTRDAPGSHVVLRLRRGADPDPEEVLDAAHLALHFSPLRGAPRGAIHVARCKEVNKPRGAPPGLVVLAGGRTLDLRVEPERLRRLLDTRPAAPP